MNAVTEPGTDALQALVHFFHLADNHDHGGARVAAKLLLGLYNGPRFPFDLTELRCLDHSNFEQAMALIRFDATPQMEVHEWLNHLYGRRDFGMRFEHIAHKWRMQKRCKKEDLRPVEPILLVEGSRHEAYANAL